MAKRARMSAKATDFWTLWGEFENWSEPVPNVPGKYKPALYATKGTGFCWVIGPYCLLKKVAENLQWDARQKSCRDPKLERALADFGVRYGARETDVAPHSVPLKKRKADCMNHPQKVEADERRESDVFPKLRDFWAGKTLEAHHIVEKGIFKVLKLNITGSALDDRYAPCVLAFAELHRRLFTPYFARGSGPDGDEPAIRQQFKDIKTGDAAYNKLCEVYSDSPHQTHLYARPEMFALGHIAEVICREAKSFGG
jgi:hypothetical protein